MTWAPAIDVENASAHASKVSISFNEGILIVTSSRICRSQRQRDSFILLKDDGDQGRSRAERRLLPVSRQTGSNPSRQLASNRLSWRNIAITLICLPGGVLTAIVGCIRKRAHSVIRIELATVRWCGNDRADVGVAYRQGKLPPYLFSAFSLAIFS